MPVFVVLIAMVQAYFVLHAMRTGRAYWWALFITVVPVVGFTAYYAVAMFPQSREYRAARRVSTHVATSFMPNPELHRRLAELQMCPSASNKVAAAEALIRCGMYYRAVGLYESALRGIYATDPQLLIGLARAHVNNQTYEQSMEVLERLQRIDARFRPEEARLLNARALEGLNRYEQALAEYESLTDVYVGLEAKCRYGVLLKRLGFEKHAHQVFNEVLVHARRSKLKLGAEQVWVDTALRSLPGEMA